MTFDQARRLAVLEKRRASWAAPNLSPWLADSAPRIIAELDREIAELEQEILHAPQ